MKPVHTPHTIQGSSKSFKETIKSARKIVYAVCRVFRVYHDGALRDGMSNEQTIPLVSLMI